ncbi:hypothetical protein SDRG_14705 [Saprolegnia diclina VS20]|uniref:Uncharacterized protein n=1 Tax=Saprolegnia diclina (strain VS20) TaxID=1156394 RepID=T0R620_SAPDV|nr:hypothetical protein SDRG_14705 [Saprolegnia diclina VS20]EQC27503.1 hypothetical protein SDRG_14705 [Saprolegnia diclina VS20]|eukprot:XP_008619077.1 hypothetical protein SDRG_14705 [Saprolegnia diclina VS20]
MVAQLTWAREMYARVVHMSVHNLLVFPSEMAVVAGESPKAPLAIKYMCWRKSVIQASVWLLLAALGAKTVLAAQSTTFAAFLGDMRSYVTLLPDVILPSFQKLHVLYVVQAFSTVGTMLLTGLCAAYALHHWTTYHRSRTALRLGYGLSFVLPYAVLLFLPIRSCINFNDIRLEACDALASLLSRQAALRHVNFSPSQVCNEFINAPQWGDQLLRSLETMGVLKNNTTRVCLNVYAVANASAHQTAHAACSEPACAACLADTTCISMGLVYMYNPSALETAHPACAACFASSCMRDCLHASLPPLLSQAPELCLPDAVVDAIKALGTFQSSSDYAEFLLGVLVGLSSLQTLVPQSMSLLFGCIRGAKLTKTLVPYSRLPGYGIGAAILLCTPMLTTFLIAIHQAFGNLWSVATILVYLASIFIWFPVGDLSHGLVADDNRGLMAPQSVLAAVNELDRRHHISFCLKLAALGLLVVYASQSDLLPLLKAHVSYSLLLRILPFCLELLGKSMMSAVVFGDMYIDFFRITTAGDLLDSTEAISSRRESALAFGTLNASPRGSGLVAPRRPSVSNPELIQRMVATLQATDALCSNRSSRSIALPASSS